MTRWRCSVEISVVRTGALAPLRPTPGEGFGLRSAAAPDHAGTGQQLLQSHAVARGAHWRAIGGDERLELPAAPAALVFEERHMKIVSACRVEDGRRVQETRPTRHCEVQRHCRAGL